MSKLLHQVGDLLELNAKLRCQNFKNDWNRISALLYSFVSCAGTTPEEYEEKPQKKISVHLASLWSS
jgi:hypothetical protein